MQYEYLPVPLDEEEEPEHPELEARGIPIDINDIELESEEVWIDPAADAWATFVTMRIKMDGPDRPSSVCTLW